MAATPLHTGGLPQGELLGRYRSYEDAQKVVDHLAADQGFDIKALTIVGNELRSVEKVRGRLSYPRVAGTGALQGALFGTFMGLLLLLFSPQDPLLNLGMAVLMGMAIWMIIGVVSFAARRGKRGFVSASQLVATTFDVVCDFQVAGKARQLVQGAQVTSLNAWNDPTGKSAALSGSPTQRTPQTTAPQPAAAQPTSETTTTPGAESAGSAGEAGRPGEQATSSSAEEEAAESRQQWQSADGKPRYGVRLTDVEQAASGQGEDAESAGESVPQQRDDVESAGESVPQQRDVMESAARESESEQPGDGEARNQDTDRHVPDRQ